MKKILSIILLPLLLGVGFPLQGSWQILDNFEDGDISDWNIDASDPDINPAAAPTATAVDDPFGLGQGKVLSVTPGAAQVANVNFRVHKDIPASMQISDQIGKSATLYFKVGRPLVSGVPGALDITWGLTAVEPPVAYGDNSLLGRYEADGVMDIRDGGSYVNLASEVALQTDTYYEIWFVIRHDLNTFDQYIRGGTDFPEQTKIYSGAGYRRETFDNLINFFLQTSAGNTVDGVKGADPAYFDDIWIDPVSVNLSTPSGWQLLDDFSDGDISDWDIDASDPDINPAAAPTATAVDDPFGLGQGKVLSVTPGAAQVANVNFRVHKDIPASMQIADQIGQSSTLYFKVGRPLVSGVPGALDITWGLTAVEPPVAYGDNSLLGRYEADGVMDIRDGGSYVNLASEVALQTDTYYEIWFVIRHDLNTFDQYIKGGTDFPDQTLLYEGAGYRRETFDNLINFFLQTSAGNTVAGVKGADPAYFDDIFIDVTSANLSSPVPTGWRKLDDFEDGDISDWNIDDSDPDINPAAAPTATAVDDPFGLGQGKVLSVTPGAAQVANVNFRVSKDIPAELQIADQIGQTSTLYFKVGRPLVSGVPGALDITWGLTAVDPPVSYGDYSLLGRYEANGGMDIRDGGSYVNLADEVALQTDVYYEVWYVIRHDLNTFDQYIKGGTDFPEQTLLYEGAGYRRETFDNLINFFLQTSAGNTVAGVKGADPAYFDDIFIDTGGINLSSPGEEASASTDVFGGVDIPNFAGWKTSSWYKNYYIDFWPWIFHDEHSWQFVDSGSTSDVIFVWDLGLENWLFLNQSTYRWMYLFGPSEGWIFTFGDNTPDRRFFQRLDDGSLFSVPAGLPTN